MIDHPLAVLFALVFAVLPAGVVLWAADVTAWTSWTAIVLMGITMNPGLAFFFAGYWRNKPAAQRRFGIFGIPVLVAVAGAGLVLLLGGTGPESALHWGWLIPFTFVGFMVGMGGIFAGAAFGNAG